MFFPQKFVFLQKYKMIYILNAAFESRITSPLQDSAVEVLEKSGETFEILTVPGAVELPILAQKVALEKSPDAIIALGCVIRGETDHYDQVLCRSTDGLSRVSLDHSVPIIHGVLACPNFETAWQRRFSGKIYARTAIEIVKTIKNVS